MAETITIGFDVTLLFGSAVTALIAWRILGGRLSGGIAIACVGLFVLGTVHVVETLLDVWFDFVGRGTPEILHRALVLDGFALLGIGLGRAGLELKREIRALKQANAELEETYGELRDYSEELSKRSQQLYEAKITATTDSLTGLLNHGRFKKDVRAAVSVAGRSDGRLGLLMVDIDDFKAVNDAAGHLAGDEALRHVARAIQLAGGDGHSYRVGGDEFAVLIPAADENAARDVAEQVRTGIQSATAQGEHTLGVSVGVASYGENVRTADELIYAADAAMYWAKSTGKNCVARWTDLAGSRARHPAVAVPSS
ncbi:MAG TPA: GGDEF domain-containing protein [Dehalococcoidia bacterium]